MKIIKILLALFIVNYSLLFAQDSTVTSFTKVSTLDSAGAFYVVQGAADRHAVWDQMVDAMQDSINGEITNGWIRSNAAIALSKLATGTAAHIIVNNVSGVPTYVALSGDATISNSGVLTLAANSVGSSEITNGSITTDDILNATITGTDIASGTITGTNITDESVTTSDIDNGTIDYTDINPNAQIAATMLETALNGQIIISTTPGVPDWQTISGDITLSNLGVVDLSDILTDNFQLTGSQSYTFDSLDISSGLSPYTISASGLAQNVILYTANTTSTIADFWPATDGQTLVLISSFTNQDQITIDHGTEIHSPTGADVVLGDPGDNVTMVYHAAYDKWVITSIQN